MIKHLMGLTTVVSLAASAIVGLGGTAVAEDTRACVTHGEYANMQSGTRAQLERSWDVRGSGTRIHRNDPLPVGFRENVSVVPGTVLVKYRLCGHGPRRAAAYVYYADSRWWLASTWREGQSPIVPAPTL